MCLRGTVICAIALVLLIEPAHTNNRILLIAASLLMFLLFVGLATRVVTALCLVLCMVRLTTSSGVVGLCEVLAVLASISLLLLGPGAYSVDAAIFGRRRVTFDAGDDLPRNE
jgi:hypothetical protein